MNKFIYCFSTNDKQELLKKGFQYLKDEIIGDKIAYVFLYDNKLSFNLDKTKFILSDRINF